MSHINILKDKNYINYDSYEKIMLSRQYNKLYKKTKDVYKQDLSIKENKRIYNLSLKDIANNFSNTILKLVNDLTIFVHQDNKSINKLMLIFTEDDRLIYVGILLFIIALSIYFVDITN